MTRIEIVTDVPAAFDGPGPTCEREDGGAALIHQADDGSDVGFFVRLQSWDDRDLPFDDRHAVFRSLMGKRVRITVEEV